MNPQTPEKLQNESANAYAWFLRYCELGADRTLDALLDENLTEMALQKVSRRTLARWSKKFQWQVRVEVYDTRVSQLAFTELLEKQKTELHDFIEKDLRISRAMQAIVANQVKTLSASDDIDLRQLRSLVISYSHSREWVKELIGLTELQEQIEENKNE